MKIQTTFCLVALLGLALTSTGCTSLHAELPSSRFESPETNGLAHRFQLNASAMTTQDDTLSPDASARPPNFSSPTVSNDTVIGAAGSFGVFDRLDIGLRTTTGPSPYLASLKFQFLGPSVSEAKQGDFSAAVTVAAGGGDRKTSGDQSGTFGPGGHNWNATTSITTTDAALILGERVQANTVLYASAFYSDYKISASVNQDASSDGSSPAASYAAATTGYQRGGNLGFQFFFGAPVYIQVEGVYTDTHASNFDHSAVRASGAIGAYF